MIHVHAVYNAKEYPEIKLKLSVLDGEHGQELEVLCHMTEYEFKEFFLEATAIMADIIKKEAT